MSGLTDIGIWDWINFDNSTDDAPQLLQCSPDSNISYKRTTHATESSEGILYPRSVSSPCPDIGIARYECPAAEAYIPATSLHSSQASALSDQPSPSTTALSSNSLKRKRPAIALDKFKPVLVRQTKGAANGAFGVFGNAKPHRGAYDPERRKEVALTRKRRACGRCKQLKVSCGRSETPYEMCRACTSLKNPLSLRLPCFLETFIDAHLFRNKAAPDHPLYFSRANVYDLRDSSFLPPEMYIVHLTQCTGEELVVNVARFLPQAGDQTALVWQTSGSVVKRIEMPPYCIILLERAKEQMLQYIERSRNAYISSLESDDLVRLVLEEARHFAVLNSTSTVRLALNLLAADRIIERDWLVSVSDDCDFPYVTDPNDMHHVKRPVTPMMDCQLDQLVIQGFLQPLRKKLLEQLQTNINTDRHGHWYDIFLTTFVLLTNAEQLLAHSRRNAIRHGARSRYNSPALATLYAHACKMFIAHFRFVCNFKGLLSIDWRSSEAAAMAKLDTEQIHFLMTLRGKVQCRGAALLDLRRNYQFERPNYWTHQIMFDGWSAGDLEAERDHINTAPALVAAA